MKTPLLSGSFAPLKTKNKHQEQQTAVFNSDEVKQNIDELLRQISNILEYVDDSVVEARVVVAINQFLDNLTDNRAVAINRGKITNKLNHVAFGRALVMDVFISILEPALEITYKEGSYGRSIFNIVELWPIRASYLKLEGQLDKFIKKLKNSMEISSSQLNDTDTERCTYTYEEVIKSLETSQMIWEVLSVISNCTKKSEMTCCLYCFRRAEPNFLVCLLHSA